MMNYHVTPVLVFWEATARTTNVFFIFFRSPGMQTMPSSKNAGISANHQISFAQKLAMLAAGAG